MDSREVADPTPFSLRMTASPDAVVWGRSFTAALARAVDVDPAEVEDVRLAASEILTGILRSHPREIRIEAHTTDEQIVFRFEPGMAPPDSSTDIDPWDIVSVLFEDADASVDMVTLPVLRAIRP